MDKKAQHYYFSLAKFLFIVFILFPLVSQGKEIDIDTLYKPTGFVGGNELTLNETYINTSMNCTNCKKIQNTGQENIKVIWQYPDDNWGKKLGRDLSGARSLKFKALGDNIPVNFSVGGFRTDSGTKTLLVNEVTNIWNDYAIDLAGIDLSNIGAGFVCTLPSQGSLYLKDIKFIF